MAGTTATYGWPYQEAADPPAGHELGQELAEAIETTVDSIDDRLDTAETDINAAEADIDALQAYNTGKGRIATQVQDTDSSSISSTTFVSIGSVTASLVSGRTYRIRFVTHLMSSVTTDTATLAIREDSDSGTEIQGAASLPLEGSASAGVYYQLETDYTAVSTGNKTFHAVCNRASGSGNVRREAASIRPTLLTVDYAYGA